MATSTEGKGGLVTRPAKIFKVTSSTRIIMQKHCSKCDQYLELALFSKNRATKDGYQGYCKACSSLVRDKDKASRYYQENKEYFKQKKREALSTKRDEINLKRKKFRQINLEKRMLASAKERAKRKGLDFNIELSDIIIPKLCPILGIELFKGETKVRKNSPSLDRIDSTKGYIKGNIQVISNLANTMKNNATEEELIAFSKYMLSNLME